MFQIILMSIGLIFFFGGLFAVPTYTRIIQSPFISEVERRSARATKWWLRGAAVVGGLITLLVALTTFNFSVHMLIDWLVVKYWEFVNSMVSGQM